MTLLNTLMKNIDKHVHQLIEWIEQTYEVDANEISAKWKEISGSGAGKTGKAQHVNSGLDPTLCQHTFRVGNNAGMQCGVKPKDGPLCSSHKPKSQREDRRHRRRCAQPHLLQLWGRREKAMRRKAQSRRIVQYSQERGSQDQDCASCGRSHGPHVLQSQAQRDYAVRSEAEGGQLL